VCQKHQPLGIPSCQDTQSIHREASLTQFWNSISIFPDRGDGFNCPSFQLPAYNRQLFTYVLHILCDTVWYILLDMLSFKLELQCKLNFSPENNSSWNQVKKYPLLNSWVLMCVGNMGLISTSPSAWQLVTSAVKQVTENWGSVLITVVAASKMPGNDESV
jgi:hypothetical protein